MENVENRKRTVRPTIRFTSEEYDLIKRKVEEAGMRNFNSFARYMLIMGEVKVINFEELRELRHAINKVGVNINQIAKKVNEEDEAGLEELVMVLELQKEMRKLISDYISKQESQTKEQEEWS
ncbi:hypothetical protein STRDD10_00405 [Streptococcus sp. DD10]|uniref:plasmid mobilization protein n=1 Tax=Streptococcus sp. DD10 TaxID=1777878 RepID=UPI000793DED7|nr:plasmid mobilization relaxosome protein MobC [Streptococcus sp. DD10]KXT75169.1 hypothetical protein STRDD10_00405 [Streptococcus sp. DD10]